MPNRKGKKLFKKSRDYTVRCPKFTGSVLPSAADRQPPELRDDVYCEYELSINRITHINKLISKYPHAVGPFKYKFVDDDVFDIIKVDDPNFSYLPDVSVPAAKIFFEDMIDWQAVEAALRVLPLPIYEEVAQELIPPMEDTLGGYNVKLYGIFTRRHFQCCDCQEFFPISYTDDSRYAYSEDRKVVSMCYDCAYSRHRYSMRFH